MAIGIDRNLYRTVAHLIFHVSEGGAVLNQQTAKGVPIMPISALSAACRLPDYAESSQALLCHPLFEAMFRPLTRN